MPTVTFFSRTVTKDKNALVPIYVRMKAGRKIDLICQTGIFIKPFNWSNQTQKAKQKADVFKFLAGDSKDEQKGRQIFDDKISQLRSFIESEFIQSHKEDIISLSTGYIPEGKERRKDASKWLKTVIEMHWYPDKYKTTLFSFIRNFIDLSEKKPNPKTGRPVSYKMRREYEVSFNYLQEYATDKKKIIDFKDINLEFYNSFTQFLQEKKLAVNTIGKKIQTLKIFLNAAKEEGLNDFEAYRSKKFVAMTEESETIYLDEAELEKLYKTDLRKSPPADRVRDLFLVGCWTGCRFSDLSQITPESISDGMIHIKQYKTGKKVVIPLHPVVTEILNKYGGQLPEPISNQKFNLALKGIAEKAKITEQTHKAITKGGVKISTAYAKNKLVTTHTARRSFATNLYKSGFPSISIMAITGHVTEKSFLKYIKVTPDEHAKKLQLHWDSKLLKVV